LGNKKVGEKVVVAGGGSVGAETALYLAQQGKKVTIIEMLDKIAVEVFDESRSQLLRLLAENGVKILTQSVLTEITANGVTITALTGEQELPADNVILALGMKSDNNLAEKLRKEGLEPVVIGDSVKREELSTRFGKVTGGPELPDT
jgi:pyruvate/2-oxoglutarate dehydrogenase complex dihydrolipoamide dehydrogenase (E3) component